MKYKVGDRVRIKSLYWYEKNKDEYGYVDCGKCLMNFEKSQLCGKIVTISRINDATNTYRIEEDNGFYDWTDEMIECKVEEKIKPKFKVGDKVKDKNNRVWFIVRVSETFFDISSINVPNAQGYFVPMEDQDDYELFPDRELPKTFEECVSVLEGENRMSLELMNTFRKLIDARNAYWKIYGEENGLGKPWEPDWTNYNDYKFVIGVFENEIIKCYNTLAQFVFAFPTEEMRDAFYEAFRKEIEICKELL